MKEFFYILLLIIINIICFLIFMRKNKTMLSKQQKNIDLKIKKLNDIIESSEQMIHELNNLSDYVTSHVEEKNNELLKITDVLEKKTAMALENNNTLDNKISDYNDLLKELSEMQESIEKNLEDTLNTKNTLNINNATDNNLKNDQHSKMLHIKNPNYIEALKMSEQGITIKEIAKKLNLGQGEVQLLLGVKNL